MRKRAAQKILAGGGSPNTASQLLGGAVGGPHGRHPSAPNFRRILPGKMRELVEQGLFVPDAEAPGGYKITEIGRRKLAELEGA